MLVSLLLLAPALAGTVVVDATLPVEVRLNGVPVVQTFGASTVTLPGVPAGRQSFTVYRSGSPTAIDIDVPESDPVRLVVTADTLTSDRAPTPDPGVAPRIELTAATGQRFAVVLDGRRFAVLTSQQALRIDDLAPGEHQLELRSADHLIVWVRGTLTIQPGDDLRLSVSEGRMVDVFGREGAWTANDAVGGDGPAGG